MENIRIFVLSYNFVPYVTSASIDFFKKIKEMENVEMNVFFVKEGIKSLKLLDYMGSTKITLTEVDVKHNPKETSVISAGRIACRWLFKTISGYRKERKTYNVILSHAFSMLSHLSAIFIKIFTRKKWIAYYSDPVKGNPYFDYGYVKVGKLLYFYKLIESVSFKLADTLVFTNKTQMLLSLNGKKEKYLSKAHIIEHCFDQRMFDDITVPIRTEIEKKRINIVHVGTMFPPKRVGSLVMESLNEVLIKNPELPIYLTFVGGVNESDYEIKKTLRYGERINFVGPVDYFESLVEMKKADILLLIDADFTKEGLLSSPFLPGKYAEYIGAKKPIMAVTMKEGAVSDMQKKLGYETLEWNKEDIKSYFERLQDVQVTKEHLDYYEKFTAKQKSRDLERIIRDTISNVE